MGRTSKHFSDRELACHHCLVNLCTQELLDALEAVRTLANKPVTVDSAYRCAYWNKVQGGVPSSQHLLGNAADIRIEGFSAGALERLVRKVPGIHGIGRSDIKGFVHIDVRRHPAQWCYDAGGKDIAYYPAPPDPQGVVNA